MDTGAVAYTVSGTETFAARAAAFLRCRQTGDDETVYDHAWRLSQRPQGIIFDGPGAS